MAHGGARCAGLEHLNMVPEFQLKDYLKTHRSVRAYRPNPPGSKFVLWSRDQSTIARRPTAGQTGCARALTQDCVHGNPIAAGRQMLALPERFSTACAESRFYGAKPLGECVNRRALLVTLCGAAPAWVQAARSAERMRRVGVLAPFTGALAEPRLAAFRTALAQLGWSEGRNLQIDYRWSNRGDELSETQARELVMLAPDVIVSQTMQAVRLLSTVNRTIPVVVANAADLVEMGIVEESRTSRRQRYRLHPPGILDRGEMAGATAGDRSPRHARLERLLLSGWGLEHRSRRSA